MEEPDTGDATDRSLDPTVDGVGLPPDGRRSLVWVAAVAGLVGVLVGAGLVALVLPGPQGPTGPVARPVIQVDGVADPDLVAAVAEVVLPSVVRVDVDGIGSGSGNGSGAIVSDSGHVVTNLHVVAGATRIEVVFHDGSSEPAALVGTDEQADLALLRVGRADLPPLARADVDDIRVGQLAVAVGAPFGLDGTVTVGVVSAIDRAIDLAGLDGSTLRLSRALQTDAEINPGNSGGPLVDSEGRMLGITSAVLSGERPSGSGVGFAVPVDIVADTVAQLIANGTVARPRLGISGRSLTPDEALAQDVAGGVLVESISPGSAAAEVDLREGDVIVAVDDEILRTIDDLVDRVREAGVGGTLGVQLVRDDQHREVTVTLRSDQS